MVAASLAVRTDRAAAWWTLAVLLPLLLLVGVFVYPSTFTVEHQTPLGWFENDIYLGLLMVATYLTVQRLRGRRWSPEAGWSADRSGLREHPVDLPDQGRPRTGAPDLADELPPR